MKRRILNIALSSALSLSILACSGGKARIIPKSTFARIYADMALADQWLQDNNNMRTVADTSLFYEAVFERYGFTADDYRRSVDHYLENPDEFKRILDRSVIELRKLEVKYDKRRDKTSEETSEEEKIKAEEEQ